MPELDAITLIHNGVALPLSLASIRDGFRLDHYARSATLNFLGELRRNYPGPSAARQGLRSRPDFDSKFG
ncbi:hypothetical protein GJ654_17575 [Rhodoblastus acidophilus]|uniref:Uncharacterized protein n=1 Tax=Rhodoblastus acidophilus TaxID=1074 RepID=A0A6N8DTB7_RHOAC|nr:hypothetical protein [Rhodoblastus acidophilus]MTV32795.1 hypothetical protein [Rhodoblastus acidophilus]